jgi:hypothetical protein
MEYIAGCSYARGERIKDTRTSRFQIAQVCGIKLSKTDSFHQYKLQHKCNTSSGEHICSIWDVDQIRSVSTVNKK